MIRKIIGLFRKKIIGPSLSTVSALQANEVNNLVMIATNSILDPGTPFQKNDDDQVKELISELAKTKEKLATAMERIESLERRLLAPGAND